MVLSQKSQYGVRAVFELAKQYGAAPVSAARIAASQHIPVRFLENILGELRQAGIVGSQRGKEGGYRLGRRPEDVTLGEVIRVFQGPMAIIECADAAGACPLRLDCVLLPVWDRAHRAMMEVFDKTTLSDLVEQERAGHECGVVEYSI